MSTSEDLVITPIPSLVSVLLRREQDKGEPLTEAEVVAIREGCACTVLTRSQAASVAKARGYDDVDPEQCWEQWQVIRLELHAATPAADKHALVLFDGVCNFCCGSVQFIIARDPGGYFQFASQQSDIGKEKLAEAGLPATLETFVLIEGKNVYTRSSAGLKVAGRLTWPWPLAGIFWLVPAFLRDAVYRLIARNRYRWFGKKEACWLPTPEIRARFLE